MGVKRLSSGVQVPQPVCWRVTAGGLRRANGRSSADQDDREFERDYRVAVILQLAFGLPSPGRRAAVTTDPQRWRIALPCPLLTHMTSRGRLFVGVSFI